MCACKSMLRNRNLLVLYVVIQGLTGSHGSHYARSRSIRCSRGCVSSFIEGQEKRRTGKYICACQDNEVFFYCFLQSCFSLQKVNHENKKKIFSLAFFVFLDRNILVNCWRCAFENTSVSVPGICLKYFKAAKDLLPGNSSDSHHTCIFKA